MTLNGTSVGIVGAGISGLACAGQLKAAGYEVELFDKAGGAGGRASTRRILINDSAVPFDHGAQYFTGRDPAFLAQIGQWQHDGLVDHWPEAGEDAWVGVPTMSAPIKAMAVDQIVQWSCQITSIARIGDRWRLRHSEGREGPFDLLVLALPAEQALVLAAPHEFALARQAASAHSDPCWALMMAFDEPIVGAPDVLRADGPIAWAARDSSKPGRPGNETWVIHASPAWSWENLERSSIDVASDLAILFADLLGQVLPPPVISVAHRWRFARSRPSRYETYWNGEVALGACGDWLLNPRIESAWMSGRSLGNQIVSSLT